MLHDRLANARYRRQLAKLDERIAETNKALAGLFETLMDVQRTLAQESGSPRRHADFLEVDVVPLLAHLDERIQPDWLYESIEELRRK